MTCSSGPMNRQNPKHGATGSGRPNSAMTFQSCPTGGSNPCESAPTSTGASAELNGWVVVPALARLLRVVTVWCPSGQRASMSDNRAGRHRYETEITAIPHWTPTRPDRRHETALTVAPRLAATRNLRSGAFRPPPRRHETALTAAPRLTATRSLRSGARRPHRAVTKRR